MRLIVLRAFCFLLWIAEIPFAQTAEGDPVNTIRIPTAGEVEPTVVAYRNYADPWEGFNRRMFAFNDFAYRHALIPVARGYVRTVPVPARDGVRRFFDNLREPLHALSHGLQGDFPGVGQNLLRFLTNSTLGVAGIFDPATAWFGVGPRRSSLDETLRRWRSGRGPFVVLPLLGPSDVRGGAASTVETLLHPLRFVLAGQDATLALGGDRLQEFAPGADSYETLYQSSDDPYLYFRNQYLQGRTRDAEFAAGSR